VTEDRSGRDLVPRPEEPASAVTPREPALPQPSTSAIDDRFSAGDQAHTVGLTEERAAQVVKQSGNARMISFLAVLLVVLFIPLYWLYDIGLPVIGFDGRMAAQEEAQFVTDVSRGYALYLANCARCHGNNGEGGVGPVLNDQGKLYNTVTAQGFSGPGHLNPDYMHNVLEVGGRYVCGDPNSVMPAWLEPAGPLNYREVEDIIRFITASKDTEFVYQELHPEPGTTAAPPITVQGWRDPAYTPPPDATPVPACWRAPTGGGGGEPSAAPVESPGTADSPRVIQVEGTADVKWIDPESGEQLESLAVVEGETIQFEVINNSTTPHNLHIGSADELSTAPENSDLPGVDTFTESTQTFTYTVENLPEQPQFACTVLGHYGAMNVDLVVQSGSGAPASPGASPEPGASPAPGSSPEASAPAESAAPPSEPAGS
jgi:mono/diheme cytochrome c family protein